MKKFYFTLICNATIKVCYFSRVAKTVNIGESKIFHLPREKCYSFSFKRYFFTTEDLQLIYVFCLCPKISKHLYSNRYFFVCFEAMLTCNCNCSWAFDDDILWDISLAFKKKLRRVSKCIICKTGLSWLT